MVSQLGDLVRRITQKNKESFAFKFGQTVFLQLVALAACRLTPSHGSRPQKCRLLLW